MFKFGTIGAFKQVRNNPRCKATADTLNGNVVIPDDASGNAPFPASASEAEGNVWVVVNIIDKPEIYNKADFKILSGEYVRAYYLPDLVGLPVELNDAVISTDYTTIANGDVLVPDSSAGKWVKADGTTIVASSYKVNLKVLEKTTYGGGQGLYAVVELN